ncbi:MAG: hypothetical protein ACOY0T_28670 [Myxococcota bacterium]
MNARVWLWLAALVWACGPSSSTGVGNPKASFSLVTVNDDVDDDVAAGGAEATGGATSTEAGATNGGSAGEAAAAGSSGSDDDVPLARGQVLHAVLVLERLHFLPCDTSQRMQVVRGPFTVTLHEPPFMRDIPPIPDVEGGYCGIDAPLGPARQPPALVGRSLYFDGVRADGTRFLVYANMQAILRLRAAPGTSWSAERTPHLLWAFRPRRWLTRAELDMAESELLDGARAIVIDVDRHPLLYARIRMRLAGRSTLYADSNDNSVIDSDEREQVLGAGVEDAD